jgi:hypothetical protein
VQVIHYAGRALRLAQDCSGAQLESEFLSRLTQARSNLSEHGDGAKMYEKWVKPAYIDIERLAGHFAISSLFENYEDKSKIYCYHVERNKTAQEAEGKLRLGLGQARFSSEITRESADFSYAVAHLGEHNIIAGVIPSSSDEYEELRKKLSDVFARADIAEIIRVFDETFDGHTFSLRSLFRDEQRKVIDIILADSLASSAAAYRSIYESQASLLRFLYDLSIPVPHALKTAAEIALNNQLRLAFERPELDIGAIHGFLREAQASHIELDTTTLEFVIRRRLEKEAEQFATHLDNVDSVHKFHQFVDLVRSLPFRVVLWDVQNVAYTPLRELLRSNGTHGNDLSKKAFKDELRQLTEALQIASP